MSSVPIHVPRDASRSRAFWDLRQALGDEEALARWPEALSDLKAMRPELSDLAEVAVERERKSGGYREAASSHVSIRLRGSGRGRRRSLTLIGFGLLFLAWPFVVSRPGAFTNWLLAAFGLTVGIGTLMMGWRRHEVRIDASTLRVVLSGRTEVELDREDIAYLEVRAIDDEKLVHQLGYVQRMSMSDGQFSASWVCAVTTSGQLISLGAPVDEAAATALCAVMEDELDLLPPPLAAMRVRVASPSKPVAVEVADDPSHERPQQLEG